MSEHTITWESKHTRLLSLWRESTNKPKSLRRPKITGPAKFGAAYGNDALTGLDAEELDTWAAPAREAYDRGLARTGDDPLDAAFEALRIIHQTGFNSTAWKNYTQALAKAHELSFIIDVVGQLHPMRDAMRPDSEPPPWRFTPALATILPQLRRLLVAAKPPEYDAAHARAAALWEASPGDLSLHLQLAFLFPTDEGWGDAVARAWPAPYTPKERAIYGHYQRTALIYATGASINALLELNQKMGSPRPEGSNLYYSARSDKEWSTLFDLLDRRGVDAAPVLTGIYDGPFPARPKELTAAMGCIAHPDVARAFAAQVLQHSKDGYTTRRFQDELTYLHAHHELAAPALLDANGGEATGGGATFDGLAADVLARVSSDAQEAAHGERYVARDTLPKGLAHPPWRDPSCAPPKRRRHDPSAFAALELLPFTTRHPYGAGVDRDAHDAEAERRRGKTSEDEVLRQLLALPAERWYFEADALILKLSCASRLELLARAEASRLNRLSSWEFERFFCVPLGDDALPALDAYIDAHHDGWLGMGWGVKIDSPLFVRGVSLALGKVNARHRAQAWIAKHPMTTANGAIHGLLTTDDSRRRNLLIETLCIAHAHDAAAVDEVVSAYGNAVAAALPELDIYRQYPARMPKLPRHWTPERWTPIRLDSDPSRLLPQELYEDIGLMLKFSPVGSPYIGLIELGEIADPTSLADFAWDLFMAWVEDEGPNKEIWMIQALGMFGGAQMARRLPFMLDRWFDSKFAPRATKILHTLTDTENPYVIETFWRLVQGGIHSETYVVGQFVEQVFEVDASIDVIADARTPTFGLNASRALTLTDDAELEVWLDADLTPHLRHLDRHTEPELDPTSALRWERLQALCAHQSAFQATRFERAMKTQRRWDLAAWRDGILAHPLLGLIAQRIVWGTYDDEGTLLATWRVDESNELLDVDENPYALPHDDGRHIRIVHPIEMGAAATAAWTALMSDYEVVQPFEQLSKPSAPIDEDVDAFMSSLRGKETTLGAILRMCLLNDWFDTPGRKRERDISHLRRKLQNNRGRDVFTVGIEWDHGIQGGTYSMSKLQDASTRVKLREVGIFKRLKRHEWSQVGDVELAELFHDLTTLTSLA